MFATEFFFFLIFEAAFWQNIFRLDEWRRICSVLREGWPSLFKSSCSVISFSFPPINSASGEPHFVPLSMFATVPSTGIRLTQVKPAISSYTNGEHGVFSIANTLLRLRVVVDPWCFAAIFFAPHGTTKTMQTYALRKWAGFSQWNTSLSNEVWKRCLSETGRGQKWKPNFFVRDGVIRKRGEVIVFQQVVLKKSIWHIMWVHHSPLKRGKCLFRDRVILRGNGKLFSIK